MAELVIALDLPTREEAFRIVDRLDGVIDFFKIGPVLYTAYGPEIVTSLVKRGLKVFLDLKFHDIPNTVAGAGAAAAGLGVKIFNIHTSGGFEMMAATREAVNRACAENGLNPPKILGVTVLTSLSQGQTDRIFGPGELVKDRVVRLAGEAKRAGLDGVVASPWEISPVKEACGTDFLVLSPGIRPAGTAGNDQARIMTPAEAVTRGSDYLVIGRPVTGADDPAAAAAGILGEMLDHA